MTDERIERSRAVYERAVFGGDREALAAGDLELDAVEAALCLARGRLVHARFLNDRREDPSELDLFERAASLFRRLGDDAGEAESLFWIGTFHQVVHGDSGAAIQPLTRAADLAARARDKLVLSYALRHLSFCSEAIGDMELARRRMQESTDLRREIGFQPGVAANLIGLAHLAARDGRRREAVRLLDEAAAIAARGDARAVQQWVAEARTELAMDAGVNERDERD